MKSWIKQQLRESLREIAPVAKREFDSGTEHSLYPSKSDPNILYKIGNKQNVLKWLTIFKKYPKFFPKTFRAAEMTNHPQLYYVAIEKLNTARVQTEWSNIEAAMERAGLMDEDYIHDINQVFVESLRDQNYENWITNGLKKSNPAMYKLFVRWLNFLHGFNAIIAPLKGAMTDIHRGNFAYDNAGNIKCIDI